MDDLANSPRRGQKRAEHERKRGCNTRALVVVCLSHRYPVGNSESFHYCMSRQENEQMDTSAYHEDLFNDDNVSFRTHRTIGIRYHAVSCPREAIPQTVVCVPRAAGHKNGLYPTITSSVVAGNGHKGWSRR